MKISALVLTKNEEKRIEKCIKALSFCDEIIVIDDNSTDKTRELSKGLGARVYKRDMNKDVSKQTNYGMKKAKGEWMLIIDADEIVTDKLKNEIKNVLKTKAESVDCFLIKRNDYFLGKLLKHGEVSKVYLPRLLKKGKGKWKRRVHQYLEIKGGNLKLRSPLLHYHNNLQDFITSINTWSSWHSLANKEEGKKSSLIKIVFYPILKFFKNYILKLGFLDGLHGFVHALIMSFHSFLSWSKQWVKEK